MLAGISWLRPDRRTQRQHEGPQLGGASGAQWSCLPTPRSPCGCVHLGISCGQERSPPVSDEHRGCYGLAVQARPGTCQRHPMLEYHGRRVFCGILSQPVSGRPSWCWHSSGTNFQYSICKMSDPESQPRGPAHKEGPGRQGRVPASTAEAPRLTRHLSWDSIWSLLHLHHHPAHQ